MKMENSYPEKKVPSWDTLHHDDFGLFMNNIFDVHSSKKEKWGEDPHDKFSEMLTWSINIKIYILLNTVT